MKYYELKQKLQVPGDIYLLIFLLSVIIVFLISAWGSQPDAHGPQRIVRPVCKTQADSRSKEPQQTENQDHPLDPQPCVEWEFHFVSPWLS